MPRYLSFFVKGKSVISKNKVFITQVVALLALTSVLQACATGQAALDKKLDEKIAAEATIKNRSDLKMESSKLLENAPGLNDDERAKLKNLREATSKNLDDLRARSLKIRSLLVKDLFTGGDNTDEVSILKNKLKDVEAKRLSDFLTAIRQANEIMGRWASRTQRLDMIYFDQMYYFDDPSF
jgi:hypothetical protein